MKLEPVKYKTVKLLINSYLGVAFFDSGDTYQHIHRTYDE